VKKLHPIVKRKSGLLKARYKTKYNAPRIRTGPPGLGSRKLPGLIAPEGGLSLMTMAVGRGNRLAVRYVKPVPHQEAAAGPSS